jgi:hypothetical protein
MGPVRDLGRDGVERWFWWRVQFNRRTYSYDGPTARFWPSRRAALQHHTRTPS